MSGGDWSVLGLTEDPVRGEPSAVRTMANAAQQDARRWEQEVQSLRAISSEGAGMEMEGDLAPTARELLQSLPNKAMLLARGRADAGAALTAYAGHLEQAKSESQMALRDGTQAKRNMGVAERNVKQIQAQMRAMSGQTYDAPVYAVAVQRFNMLRAQEQKALQSWRQAEAQWRAAQQRARDAGQRATQQEQIAAQKVSAAAPTAAAARALAAESSRGGGRGGRAPARPDPGVGRRRRPR